MIEFLINTYLAIPQFALVILQVLLILLVYAKFKTKGSTDLFVQEGYKVFKYGVLAFVAWVVILALSSQLSTPRNTVDKIPAATYDVLPADASAGTPQVLKDRLLKPEPTEERQLRLDKEFDSLVESQKILKGE